MRLPKWLEETIDEKCKCKHCTSKMSKEFVTGFGIKEDNQGKNKYLCWIEYLCLSCEKTFTMVFKGYSIQEFIGDVLEINKEINEEKTTRKKPARKRGKRGRTIIQKEKKKKSCITDDEYAEAIKIINRESWNDVLVGFGITGEQIEKYNQEGSDIDNKKQDKK